MIYPPGHRCEHCGLGANRQYNVRRHYRVCQVLHPALRCKLRRGRNGLSDAVPLLTCELIELSPNRRPIACSGFGDTFIGKVRGSGLKLAMKRPRFAFSDEANAETALKVHADFIPELKVAEMIFAIESARESPSLGAATSP